MDASHHAGRSRRAERRPELHQLEVFLAVVEASSFSGAARSLGCTQPAVSQTIARLQNIFGADLFERRSGRPLRLTTVGERVLPFAKSLLHTMDGMIKSASKAALGNAGTLRVGIQPGLPIAPLARAVAELCAVAPDLLVQLIEIDRHVICRALRDRQIHLALSVGVPDALDSQFIAEPLWREQLLLAIREGHELATEGALNWTAVRSVRLLSSTTQPRLDDLSAVIGDVTPRTLPRFEHLSTNALVDLAAAGLGATLVLASEAMPRPGLSYRSIEELEARATIFATYPSGDQNPLRYRLVKLLRSEAISSRETQTEI